MDRHKQAFSFVVADGLLAIDVPANGAAELVGDVTEMAGRDRAVGRFGRGDALFPGFDAIEEITGVAGGGVGFPGAAIKVGFRPARIGRFDFAAVHPKPAIFTDPLRAALDI